MTTGTAKASKWSVEDVERLGRFMRAEGISLISLPGLKVMRHPQEAFNEALAKESAKVSNLRGKEPTDEELLFNPMAGLSGGLTHG